MWMDFTCLLYFSAAHQFQNANTISNSPTTFDPFCLFFWQLLCGSRPAFLCCVHIYLSSETTFLSSLPHIFSPFRYLFNLIWFHFRAVVVLFLLALSHIDRSGGGLNISIPVHSCFVPTTFFPSFDCNSFVSVLLNYLKLIKPRTWIDFRFARF